MTSEDDEMVDLAEQLTHHDVAEAHQVTLLPSLRGRSILRDTDLSRGEIEAILDLAIALKDFRARRVPHAWLAGRTLGMIFQHPSTRTRNAFQAGMEQLGGHATFLGAREFELAADETLPD
ncbi:MAG: hypothetical protein M3173_03270, partial [Chloroflexota bacterium]|nr:hypothetical protein [Chloroflexota bacterium]